MNHCYHCGQDEGDGAELHHRDNLSTSDAWVAGPMPDDNPWVCEGCVERLEEELDRRVDRAHPDDGDDRLEAHRDRGVR